MENKQIIAIVAVVAIVAVIGAAFVLSTQAPNDDYNTDDHSSDDESGDSKTDDDEQNVGSITYMIEGRYIHTMFYSAEQMVRLITAYPGDITVNIHQDLTLPKNTVFTVGPSESLVFELYGNMLLTETNDSSSSVTFNINGGSVALNGSDIETKHDVSKFYSLHAGTIEGAGIVHFEATINGGSLTANNVNLLSYPFMSTPMIDAKNCEITLNNCLVGWSEMYYNIITLRDNVKMELNATNIAENYNGYNDCVISVKGDNVSIKGSEDAKITNNSAYGGTAFIPVIVSGKNCQISDIGFCGNKSRDASAIYVKSTGAGCKIEYCNFDQNTSADGTVFIDAADCVIDGCNFSKNKGDDGSAIYVDSDGNRCAIKNCKFTDNVANGDGTVYLNVNCTVENSTFTNNSAEDEGSAIYVNGSSCAIKYCTFTENKAGTDGTVYVNDEACKIENSTFTNNSASDDGSAVYINKQDCSISNCTMTGNTAADEGTIYVDAKYAKVTACTITNNTSDDGILYLSFYSYNDDSKSTYIILNGSIISDNTVLDKDSSTLAGKGKEKWTGEVTINGVVYKHDYDPISEGESLIL